MMSNASPSSMNRYLPEVDTSLQVRLGILTPEIDRAIAALQNDDGDEFDHVLGQVVPTVDRLIFKSNSPRP
jgi:hypothetical protein